MAHYLTSPYIIFCLKLVPKVIYNFFLGIPIHSRAHLEGNFYAANAGQLSTIGRSTCVLTTTMLNIRPPLVTLSLPQACQVVV